MTRLEFLRYLGAACVCAAAGGLSGCAGIPVYRAPLHSGKVTLGEDEFDALLEDREDAAILIRPDEDHDALILVRTSANTYRAVSAVCTHQRCEVRLQQGGLRCPCHGSSYTLDGSVTRGPAQSPLPVYPVSVTDGVISIDLTNNIQEAGSR